mgnify:CR=1 FL=1
MKYAVCHLPIKIYEFDLLTAFKDINPITFRVANMHFDCFEDACDIAKETESKKSRFQNRYDEYLTTKL